MRKRIEFYRPDNLSEPFEIREWCLLPWPGLTIVLDAVGEEAVAYTVLDTIVIGDEDDFYWRLTVSEAGT